MDSSSTPPLFMLRRASAPRVPLVVSIPHTGIYTPPEIAARFASKAIAALPMTDWHLDSLYDFLPALGISTVVATHSRFVVDLNRPPDGGPLYPGRFETGLVPEQTFQGEAVFERPPTGAEKAALRVRYHRPYHRALKAQLDATIERFGRAVLIDAHSVASAPSLLHGELTDDIYLGNRDGDTCAPRLLEVVAAVFADAGLKVSRNAPYKGGYTTAHYGSLPNVQALQIEMCQRVYMDESDPEGATSHPRFAETQVLLRRLFETLARVDH